MILSQGLRDRRATDSWFSIMGHYLSLFVHNLGQTSNWIYDIMDNLQKKKAGFNILKAYDLHIPHQF